MDWTWFQWVEDGSDGDATDPPQFLFQFVS